jgi:hypothetical protein
MNDCAPEHLRDRIRGEYLEMPGLQLTAAQMQRLGAMDRSICQTVLDALVDEHFLYVTPTGAYARTTDGTIARPRAAKAVMRRPQRVEKAS